MPNRLLDFARRRAPAVLGLGAFALYALVAPAGPYWLDSQELGAAATQLGVPHPTGFPLFCLLGRLASMVPIGELAYRVHLLSALCAAITVGLVARLVIDLLGEDASAVVGGIAAGVVLAFGATFFRQATVTEVYAPTAVLLAATLRVALRALPTPTPTPTPTPISTPTFAGLSLFLLAGIGATGVHATYRFLGLPLAVILVVHLVRRARWARVAPLLALLGGVATAIYLPLRSAAGPAALDWGHPRTFGALWDHLNAARIRAAYAGDMFSAHSSAGDSFHTFTGLMVGDLGVVALLFAAGGLIALLAGRRTRAAGAILGFVALSDAVYSIWINPMGLIERQNGVPFAVAAALLAGVGLAAGARRLGSRVAPYAAAAAALLAAAEPALADWPARLAATSTDAPRAWAEAALAQSPPGAIVLVQSDSLASNLFWLTLVEGARPDVAPLVRQHAWDRRRTAAVLRRAGVPRDEAAALAASAATATPGETASAPGAPPAERTDLAARLAATGRPIAWEVGVDTPPPDLAPSLPVGLVGAPTSDLRPTLARVGTLFPERATRDPNARRFAVRAYTNLGTFFASARDLRGAARATDLAVLLDDHHVTALVNGARYHMALDEDETAAAFARTATELAPENADAWALLGTLDARAHRCPEARAHLDRALALDPHHPDASVNRPRLAAICP